MAVPQASGGDGEARTQVRCLVVDDHAAVREGVKMILTRDREISVIGESSSGDGAVEMAEKRRPDVIVMDVRMEGGAYVDPTLASELVTPKATERLPALSGREREILALLANGFSNPDIAQRLRQ